ncbi:MAG: serine hydrolase domain-containing protein, partial [Saprospiraceae bacterium]|nr:serine hydrolase domain-containing protein [Saprospiraceae bacterium]
MKTPASLFFILLFIFSGHTQPVELETRISQLMEAAGIPGLSVACIEDGKIDYLGAFGLRSRDTRLAVDEETVFSAASLSKPVFAYIALQLVEEG